MNLKLLIFKELLNRKQFDSDSITDTDIDVLLELAPKKTDDHYTVTNNSFEILNLLIHLDLNCDFKLQRIRHYLLDFTHFILRVRLTNQLYTSKSTGKIDLLEFEVIDKINHYIIKIIDKLRFSLDKQLEKAADLIKSTFSQTFDNMISKLSVVNDKLEKNFEKNEILWLRSFLNLPINNSFAELLINNKNIEIVRQELVKLTQISLDQILHDGFYRTGVLIHFIGHLSITEIKQLSFIIKYSSSLLKKYITNEESTNKIYNTIRLSLEASLLSENIAGVSGDVASKISISRVITNITTDIHFGIHRFDFNFISEILKTFKTTFERTNSNEQRLKILERFFKFYIKYQGSTTSFLQMMTDHKAGNERPSLDPKQKAYAQKFKNITKLMKKFLTELIADNQAQKHFDLETLSNDFIMFLFKSLSQVNSMHLDVDKITSDADTNNNIKDNPKNPIYYLNFLYHLIKQNCHTKLIYNLISSRFSLKSCLGQLKQTLTHKDEKSFDQIFLKIYFQAGIKMRDDRVFEKSLTDLVSYYGEIIEDPKLSFQEEFIFKIFKKTVSLANEEEILFGLCREMSNFLFKVSNGILEKGHSEDNLKYFVKNLGCFESVIRKLLTLEDSQLSKDPKFIEKIIEIWICIVLHRDVLLKRYSEEIKSFAAVTPRLFQYSSNTYSNTFLIHPYLKSQKTIDKFRRNFKHILREKMIALRPKIRNLSLGEMVFLLSLDFILDSKIELIVENTKNIIEYERNVPFIEMILCYLRENTITEKENLKEVLEELLYRKAEKYLNQLIKVKNESLQISLAEKDLILILQSCCSINPIYAKLSQLALKEYINEFPHLIMRSLVLKSICEIIDFFGKKIRYQYDSISSKLKVSSYNLKITLPTDLKSITDVFLFLLAYIHSYFVRGYLIDSDTLMKSLENLFASSVVKQTKVGVHIMKYLLWTLNNHIALTNSNSTKSGAYWYYDRPAFIKRAETFQNKHLEDGLKVINTLPVSSTLLNIDSISAVQCLTNVLKSFKVHEEEPIDMLTIKKKGTNIGMILEELRGLIANSFIYNIILKDRNHISHSQELLKNRFIQNILDPEIRDLLQEKRISEISEMIKTKISSSFVRITTLLQLTTQYIRANPSEAIRVMSKIFDIGLAYPVPKVMKYVIKKMTKSVLVSVPISYTENIFSIVSLALKYLVSQFNCYSRISMLGRKDSSGYNIMEVNSEEFGRIRFSEWCEASEHYSVLNYKLSKYFMTFRNRQETFIQDIKSISVGRYYLKKVFNSVHKDLMCFVSSNLSILVASHVNLADIMLMLCENFMLEESSLEHLHNDTVFATIIAHFDLVSLLKSQNLSDHKKRQLEKFYMKTLKLGLNNFARNARFYYDGTFESEASLEKIEKKIDLGTRACRYLKIETFLEGNSPISKDLATFPKLFFDLNYYSLEGSKYKFKFQNKASKWNFSRSLVNSIGPLSNNSETIYHSVVYDCSAESKGILGSTQYSGKVANLKKILYYFCVVDVDAMRAFFKTDLGNLKFEYTMEDKGLGENEVKNLISTALEFGTNLAVNMMTKFMTMIPQLPALTNNIRDAIQKYHVFNYQFRYLIDYFIEKNLANTNILRNLFYWDTPQFPLLMKYVTTNYDKYKVLQVYFTKTMKRLDSDQLTYYLPQIYQIMNTKANYIVGETLRDYGKKSFLFSHQLIWKTKVETKREKGETEGGTLTSISKILLRKILKSMTPLEKSIFKQVDDFFESITAISGILRPKMPKPEKKSIIKENLEKIPLNDFLYIPSNPYYKIAKIKLDSGTPMQSAAKCPIMITFYCQKYEGPDSYYQRLIVSQQSVNSYTNDEDLAPENIQESTGINNLRETTGIKLFPKEKLNPWGIPTSFVRNHENAENRSFVLERIPEKFANENIDEEQEDDARGERLEIDVIKKSDRSDVEKSPYIHRNTDYYPKSPIKVKATRAVGPSQTFVPSTSIYKIANTHETGSENENLEPIACIFKVFDDIRQDNLALQVIKLFKQIFQSVGLDLYLFPYKTISNRTGPDGDIGGIIEVVPNTISRDQMGKTNDYDLYEYFRNKFGNEMSPEFQHARYNFIKSMAAYSIVSYILQIKDRHNGNILIDQYGHLIHIDFGFIFDISPAHNMKFESANFKLTKEMIQIMGGSDSAEPFNHFVDQTIKAFLAVRRYEEQIFNMIKLMTYSGLKCFRQPSLANFKDRFMPKSNDLVAANAMKKIVYDAYNKWTTNRYDDIQKLQNNIHR